MCFYSRGGKDDCGLLINFADRAVPVRREHSKQSAGIIIQQLPEYWQKSLPFRDGNPGKKRARNFYDRHKNDLKHNYPSLHEGERYAAVNAEVLKSHFSDLEALMIKYNFDASRVWNLDETGCTQGKDTTSARRRKYFFRRNAHTDLKLADRVRSNRVTILPCVSA